MLLLLVAFGCNISQQQIIFTTVYILLFFMRYYITISLDKSYTGIFARIP